MLKRSTRHQMLAHVAVIRSRIDRQERIVARLAELGDAEVAERAASVLLALHINHSMQLEMVDLLPEREHAPDPRRAGPAGPPGLPLPH